MAGPLFEQKIPTFTGITAHHKVAMRWKLELGCLEAVGDRLAKYEVGALVAF
jgi:hypothetical protein